LHLPERHDMLLGELSVTFCCSNRTKEKTVFQARQGDLLIESKSLPKAANLKRKEDHIVAYGEVTGHCHKIVAPNFDNVDMFVDPSGDVFVQIKDAQTIDLVHDEHGPINLEGPGEFCISSQREYDPAEAARERRVKD